MPVVVGTVPCVGDTAGVSLAVVVDIVQLCQLRRSVQIQRHPAVPECVKGLHIGVVSGSPVDQRIGDGGEIRTQEQQRRGSTDERHNQHRCPMAEFGAVIGNAVQRIDTNPLHQPQRCKQQQIPHSGKGIGHGAVQHHGFQRNAALELGELQLDLPQRSVRVNLEVAGAPLPRRIFFADDLKRLGEIVVLDGGLHPEQIAVLLLLQTNLNGTYRGGQRLRRNSQRGIAGHGDGAVCTGRIVLRDDLDGLRREQHLFRDIAEALALKYRHFRHQKHHTEQCQPPEQPALPPFRPPQGEQYRTGAEQRDQQQDAKGQPLSAEIRHVAADQTVQHQKQYHLEHCGNAQPAEQQRLFRSARSPDRIPKPAQPAGAVRQCGRRTGNDLLLHENSAQQRTADSRQKRYEKIRP